MSGANQKGGGAGGRFANLLRVPLLTPRRIALAFAVAIAADVLQWFFAATMFLPFSFDDVIDLVAMIALWRLLGFHFLLLPAFLVELVPGVELLPTWLLSVAYLVRLRSKEQRLEGAAEEPPARR